MATSPWYKEGAAQFTQGSATVKGTGTEWVKYVRAGDGIQGPDGKLYQVTNVASNTSMSITPAYGSETTYWTIPIQGYVKRLADAASQLVRDFEGGADEALDAANRAKQSAIEAKVSENKSLTEANRAESEADRAETEADRAQQAADDAVAVVSGGEASIDPEPGKIPIAGAEGTIKQAWVHELEFALDKLRAVTNKALYGDGPYPVLDFQFQGANMLDPRVEFTRTSKDWDSQGREYGINEPVLTSKGLWTSGARTNLCSIANLPNEWTRIGSSFIESTPFKNGVLGKFRRTSASGSSTAEVRLAAALDSVFSSQIIVGFFDSNPIEVRAFNGTAGSLALVSLNRDGTFTNSGTQKDTSNISVALVADGLFLVKMENLQPEIGSTPAIIRAQYTGGEGGDFHAGLPQIELGPVCTSYMPTEGSQVTVAPTVSQFINTAQSPEVGTFFIDFVAEADFLFGSVLGSGDNNVNPIFHGSVSEGVGQDIRSATSPADSSNIFFLGTDSSVKKGDRVKVASGYDFHNKKSFVCVNGVYEEFDVNGNPSLTYNLLIIMRRASGIIFKANTHSLNYYNEYLTQQQAEELTTL